jgi:CPA2 family monovalent cation:H+ antiporter-2
LCSPFLWAIIFSKPPNELLKDQSLRQRLKALEFGIAFFRVILALGLLGFVVSQFLSLLAASGAILLVLALAVIFSSRLVEPFYRAFEKRFISNLNDREEGEEAAKPALAPWDATLAEFTLSPSSDLVAKSLLDSQLKERFGVTVALIERGHRRILAPGRTDLLLPFDKIFLIGTDEQLEAARKALEVDVSKLDHPHEESFGLESLVLSSGSPFVGKSIRTCGLREAISGLIVGIERQGRRILSPDSAMILEAGDLIWAVGDRRRIRGLVKPS